MKHSFLTWLRNWLPRGGGARPSSDPGERSRARFHEVGDGASLQGLLAGTGRTGPVALFLHDPWCPVSVGAWRELEKADADIFVVDVSARPDLSRAVERATGVRHQSPQVIVLAGGRVLWHGSHWRVRREALAEALRTPA